MLWDNPALQFIGTQSNRRGLALALVPATGLPARIAYAIHVAGIDLVQLQDGPACLEQIPIRKPDVLIVTDSVPTGLPDLHTAATAARATETLPILTLTEQTGATTNSQAVASVGNDIETFLKLRAILRRERPCALAGKRQKGALVLDERGFKLIYRETFAEISKTDLCILGPFFDVKDAIFDRQSLEALAFNANNRDPASRSIDVHISRLRRRVRAKLGVDPLCSVRGVGYTLRVT